MTRTRQLTLFRNETAHVPGAGSMAQLPYAYDAFLADMESARYLLPPTSVVDAAVLRAITALLASLL